MELVPRSRDCLQKQALNFAKHLRWSFFQKHLKTKSLSLFVRKAPTSMFDKVLNMRLNWLPKSKMFPFLISLNIQGNRKPTRKNQKERAKPNRTNL